MSNKRGQNDGSNVSISRRLPKLGNGARFVAIKIYKEVIMNEIDGITSFLIDPGIIYRCGDNTDNQSLKAFKKTGSVMLLTTFFVDGKIELVFSTLTTEWTGAATTPSLYRVEERGR